NRPGGGICARNVPLAAWLVATSRGWWPRGVGPETREAAATIVASVTTAPASAPNTSQSTFGIGRPAYPSARSVAMSRANSALSAPRDAHPVVRSVARVGGCEGPAAGRDRAARDDVRDGGLEARARRDVVG